MRDFVRFMAETTADLFREAPHDWLVAALAVLMVVSAALVAAIIAIVAWWSVNYAFVEWQPTRGEIERVEFEPAHSETDWVPVGNAMIPTQRYVSDEWSALVRVGSERVWVTSKRPKEPGPVALWVRRGRIHRALEGSF